MNGHSTAHGACALYGILARRGLPVTAGSSPPKPPSASEKARAFGHDGSGGSGGLADPEAELSLDYVMNRMGPPQGS
ncbi:hypothetical protein STRIP9103_09344 [Streptomyces ipomoeae 91-03]|uniref:Uncharacterized protein n=1 Tax=Streptomyces ipomoeae 91-03 TaxID=698759 RepID=L1KJD7_9ACTN|nr:hypothetical protein STRIP9103_09344 [Streptomyces ipomoeae 91-03]